MEYERRRGERGPINYFTEEERIGAIRRSKREYMANKDWYCDICPIHNYKLAGKWNHIRTEKHKRRAAISSIKKKLNDMREREFLALIGNIEYVG